MSALGLSCGYAVPFAIELPNGLGFNRGGDVEIALEFTRVDRYCAHRLEMLLALFSRLAATGALAGKSIQPAASGFEFKGLVRHDPLCFVASFGHVAIDDAALIVLVNLLVGARRRLALSTMRLNTHSNWRRESVAQSGELVPTYPEAFEPLPFPVEDEGPETDALLFDIEFQACPKPAAIVTLNSYFEVWASAVQHGAYALAPYPPEESHVESYADGFTAIGCRAERSYHKLRADDAAVAAALNMLSAFHRRFAPIASVRLA